MNPTPANYPKALHRITGIGYVRFVGYNWRFCPGVGPILFPKSFILSAREFRVCFIKAG
jgi:hypothetical protein